MAHYRFSNLLGAPYRGGNLCIRGTHLLTSVGNRVNEVDLHMSSSTTLPSENLTDIACIAVSPSGSHMISFDTDGRAILVNLRKRVVLHHMNFKGKVAACEFSPCGRSFAVCVGKAIQIWATPTMLKEFAPFRLLRAYGGMFDAATCVAWSADSRWVVVGSKDLSARVYSANHVEGYVPPTLGGHREPIVAVAFDGDGGDAAYTVSKDGALFEWRLEEEEEGDPEGDPEGRARDAKSKSRGARAGSGTPSRPDRRWRMRGKHFFHQPAKLTCAAYHAPSRLLCAGFAHGVFTLHRVGPGTFEHAQTLSISREKVSAVTFNASGDWIALGCERLGQLVVWEWQSEAYVHKQQGHSFDVNRCAYAPDGSMIATAADDHKVKVWSASTGSCFVTFAEHSGPVSAVAFLPSGHAVLSASLDGTVRAFDLMRYRNFRVLTSPDPCQFCSLAVDPSGEVVCAGSVDTFTIHVWSLKTGRLLDVLAGHQGPVTSLAFSPESSHLASGSWDKTVRLWDVYGGRGQTETFPHAHDVLALAFRPDGKQIAVSALDGQIFLWNPDDARLEGTIEGRRDAAGGRTVGDLRSAANAAAGRAFKTLAYSADGALLLAGGDFKSVLAYDVEGRALLKKFALSKSKAMDGVIERLDSNRVTDAGPMDLLPGGSDSEDDDDRGERSQHMPGAGAGGSGAGGSSARKDSKKRRHVRCKHVAFAPTGHAWAASTTEGVMVFSRDVGAAFDPTDLGEDVTPSAARFALRSGDSRTALLMALRLRGAEEPDRSIDPPASSLKAKDPAGGRDASDEEERASRSRRGGLVAEVLEGTAPDAVASAVREFPAAMLPSLLDAIASCAADGPHAQLMLRWTREVCAARGRAIHDAAHGGLDVGAALVGGGGGGGGGGANRERMLPALRRLGKAFATMHEDLAATAEASVFMLDYVCAAPPAS